MISARALCLLACLALPAAVGAETLYVTDRILLGLHTKPQADSQLVASLPSGSAVEILQRRDDFAQIKAEDGTTGWVSTAYLMAKPPAQQLLDNLNQQHAQLSQERDQLRKKLTQAEQALKERETALAASQAAAAAPATPAESPPPDSDELQAAAAEIATLREQLQALQEAAVAAEPVSLPTEDTTNVAQLQQENTALRARIELALANLQGEQLPAPEELAAIRPEFPLWYLAWIVVAVIAGFAIGALWLDHRHRSRLGGFRI